LLGTIAATIGYASSSPNETARRRYVPLPINRPFRPQAPSAARIRGILAFTAVIAWCAAELIAPAPPGSQENAGFEYPMPVSVKGSARPMVPEARTRYAEESGPVLPGLSSYLAHNANQEAIPFLRIGESRVDPFAETDLPLPGGEARAAIFDDSWARKAYAALPSVGIEAMLLAQDGPVVGRSDGSRRDGAPTAGGRPLAPMRCLLYIFLLIASLARLSSGLLASKGSLPSELRQEA